MSLMAVRVKGLSMPISMTAGKMQRLKSGEATGVGVGSMTFVACGVGLAVVDWFKAKREVRRALGICIMLRVQVKSKFKNHYTV